MLKADWCTKTWPQSTTILLITGFVFMWYFYYTLLLKDFMEMQIYITCLCAIQGTASKKVSWVNQFPPSKSKRKPDASSNGDSNVFVCTNPNDTAFTIPSEAMPSITGDASTSIQYLSHGPPSPEFDVDPALKNVTAPKYVRCSGCGGYAVIN